jgi:hypothetical protein
MYYDIHFTKNLIDVTDKKDLRLLPVVTSEIDEQLTNYQRDQQTTSNLVEERRRKQLV